MDSTVSDLGLLFLERSRYYLGTESRVTRAYSRRRLTRSWHPG